MMNPIKSLSSKLSVAAASTVTALSLALPASAAGDPLAGVAITSDMLAPLVSGVTANIGVILPVGISIFAIMIGISLVPKLIKRFTKG